MHSLLLDWMARYDGPKRYYSSNTYNLGAGEGSIQEIRKRRTWRAVKYWQSDEVLSFAKPARQRRGWYRRNEFLYIGRTSSGILRVPSISIEGDDKAFFTVTPTRGNVRTDGHIRIKVSFASKTRTTLEGIKASVVIRNNANGVRRIPIVGECCL